MFNKASVLHQTFGGYAYYIDEKDVHLTIRVAKGEANKVVCEYYDKYENVPHKQIEMQKQGTDVLFDYFCTIVRPEHRRLNYFFRVYAGKKQYLFKQYGFTENANDGDYQLPYLNPCDIHAVPDWLKKAVVYQIFPDAFSSFGQKQKLLEGYFGGTLKGITKNVDHIKKLGANVVYLNPIFCSTSVHRYDVVDYYNIDPILGTKTDFKTLVQTCHTAGIKVVLDAVFNHSSYKNPMFLDVLENGKKSKYANYYAITSYKNGKVASYDRFGFENYMPKLNTSNPEVQKYLIDVLLYWITEFDIDGWRFDVGNEIGHEFMAKARSAVKSAKPDAYLLGEIWHEPQNFLFGDEYDGVTNFVLKDLIFRLHKSEVSAKQFVEQYNTYYFSLPRKAIDASSSFLCNHDTTRVATEFKNQTTLMSMIALQFIMPGTPLIYYGEEVGMLQDENFKGDRGARTPIDFEKANNNPLFDFYKKIVKLKTSGHLQGDFELRAENGLLVVTRKYKCKQVKLVINANNKPKKHVVDVDCSDYLTESQISKSTKLTIPQNNFVILVK